MTYRIEGLPRDAYAGLLGLTDAELAERGARRVTADAKPGFPCRVALEDAEPGERLILFNHVSHDVPTPFRTAHAIYVREEPGEPACYVDDTPPVFEGAVLSLRGFDAEGMLPGRCWPSRAGGREDPALFERPEIAEIHAHSAAAGCFAAKIVRD